MTARIRIASIDRFAQSHEAEAFRLPSFSRMITFHLPTLLRNAGDSRLLHFVPSRGDSLGECRVKLEMLRTAAFASAPGLNGMPLEMMLEVGFVATGLRAYLDGDADGDADQGTDRTRLLRAIERHSGRLIINARAAARQDSARRPWLRWWFSLSTRLGI